MKKKLIILITLSLLGMTLIGCQKETVNDGINNDVEQSTTDNTESENKPEQNLVEKIYGVTAFAISIDQNQWLDNSGTGYGWYYYKGTGKEVETIIIQDSNWEEGITSAEDVPAIVEEKIDERFNVHRGHQNYNRTEDSREQVNVNGVDMLRVTGTFTLEGSEPGTRVIAYDYIGYFFLANNSIGVRNNCPSYLIALAKKSDFEDESYVYDEDIANKNLSLIDEIIKTYKVY